MPKYSRIDHVKHIKYYLKFFKGCLPLVLHYPFLNTSSPYASRIFRIHVTMFSHLKYLILNEYLKSLSDFSFLVKFISYAIFRKNIVRTVKQIEFTFPTVKMAI